MIVPSRPEGKPLLRLGDSVPAKRGDRYLDQLKMYPFGAAPAAED